MRDLLGSLNARSKKHREWALQMASELSEEQLRWRPAPDAHSIAWTLWHVARADDNFVRDITGGSIWNDGGHRERWGLSSDRMNRMSGEEAAAMDLPPKEQLLEYVTAVFAATDAAIEGLPDARYSEEIDSRFTGKHTTLGELCVIVVSHDARHLGEMEYIKGLQGMSGTVTI